MQAVAEREDRARQQAERETRREKERAVEEAREHAEEECERKRLEEEEQRKEEAYQQVEIHACKLLTQHIIQLRATFEVQDTGVDSSELLSNINLRQRFIEYIQANKIVSVDELGTHDLQRGDKHKHSASAFNLRTSAAAARLRACIDDGVIRGVADDRGRFIHVTDDDLQKRMLLSVFFFRHFRTFSCLVHQAAWTSLC